MPRTASTRNGDPTSSSSRGDDTDDSICISSSGAEGVHSDTRRFNIMSLEPPPVPEEEECVLMCSFLESKVQSIQVICGAITLIVIMTPTVSRNVN